MGQKAKNNQQAKLIDKILKEQGADPADISDKTKEDLRRRMEAMEG